jgi:hypothetical protein
MRIQIIGPREDPAFQDIRDVFLQAVHEMRVEATIDLVTRLDDIQQLPRVLYPAVIIDGHLMCQGHVITLERARECIREWLEITK